MQDCGRPAFDNQGNPAPGVILGDDGSITIGTQCIIRPMSAADYPCFYHEDIWGGIWFNDGRYKVGAFVIPAGYLTWDLKTGCFWIGGKLMFGPHSLTHRPLVIKTSGAAYIHDLYFKPGHRVCLVSAHKAAKKRWTAARAAWIAACVCISHSTLA
jgi:hypothetical protein